MSLDNSCISDCPPGYLANYSADTCQDMDNLEAKMIYFPFLILTLLCLGLSFVGSRQKRKHLLIPNFIVMMGIIEHVALVTQIILTYYWATWRFMVFIIIFWIMYVVCNILFQIKFKKEIIDKDKYYMMWRKRPENLWSRKLMNALGWVFSWKEYKLTYSGFWGYRIRPARFSTPSVYRDL